MAGYSGTPLNAKLGLTEGLVMFVINSPSEYFDLITPLPNGLIIKDKLSGDFDFIHLFVSESAEFKKQFMRCKTHLKKTGMMWVSWPKKSSKFASDLDENLIRDFGLQEGLVDVKVCAVNNVWSGLKFVYRKKDR